MSVRARAIITSRFGAQIGVRFERSERTKSEAYPSICRGFCERAAFKGGPKMRCPKREVIIARALSSQTSHFFIAFVLLLLSACSIQLTPQVLPNVKLDKLPDNSGNLNLQIPLTDQSKTDQKKGQKSLIINLIVETSVAQVTGIDPSLNCVQLVELSSEGTVVVDFTADKCPPDNATAHADTIRFTASYKKLGGDDYELIYREDSREVSIGGMRVNTAEPSVSLKALCTSNYQMHCYIESRARRFYDILVY